MATTLTTRMTLMGKIKSGDEIGWADFYDTYKNFITAAA